MGELDEELNEDRVPDTLRRLREGTIGEPARPARADLRVHPDPHLGLPFAPDFFRAPEVRGRLVSLAATDDPLPGAPRRPAPRRLQPDWTELAIWGVLGLWLGLIFACNPLMPGTEESHITTEGSIHEGGKQ